MINRKYSIFRICSFTACLLAGGLFGAAALLAQTPKLTFATKNGNVTFDHAAHAKRASGDCGVCHDKLFKKDSSAPLDYKAGMHRPAEAQKISCASCHVAGGAAFESKGNCAKCHVKG